MFLMIRAVTAILLFIGLVIGTIQNGTRKPLIKTLIWFLLSIAVYYFSQLFKFEQLYARFDSPEAAYEYFNPRHSSVVIRGNKTAYIHRAMFVMRSGNQWKYLGQLSSQSVLLNIETMDRDKMLFLEIRRCNNTQECFLYCESTSDFQIKDDHNSTINVIREESFIAPGSNWRYYTAFLGFIADGYTITIDDLVYVFSEGSFRKIDARHINYNTLKLLTES